MFAWRLAGDLNSESEDGGGEDNVVQVLELIQQTRAEHRKLQRLGLDTSGRGGDKYRQLVNQQQAGFCQQGTQVCAFIRTFLCLVWGTNIWKNEFHKSKHQVLASDACSAQECEFLNE